MHFILLVKSLYTILYIYVVLYLLFNHNMIFFSHWTIVKWQYFYNENCMDEGLLPGRGPARARRHRAGPPLVLIIMYIW